MDEGRAIDSCFVCGFWFTVKKKKNYLLRCIAMCFFRKPGYPTNQVYWYLKTINKAKPLAASIKVDVVIVGGGMAGLHAAQSFKQKGCSVVLLEHYFCGAGATGKSSGFITPNSELGLEHYYLLFGPEKARHIWDFVCSGVQRIHESIKTYEIACDYQVQDTLVVANNAAGMKELAKEHNARLALNYESALYNADEVQAVIGSSQYVGGNLYGSTFGINPYAYAQEFKEALIESGIQIFEETPVLKLNAHSVETPNGTVQADTIIVCADRFIPELQKLKKEIYHVQTFLMASAPLEDKTIKTLFPEKKSMVWDTDLVYQYYRMTGENRLLLGGGSVWSSYLPNERHNAFTMYHKLNHYFKKKFPQVSIQFEYMWPGLIGISKDLIPVAGRDAQHESIYYVGAATGLPWAAALGNYSAEHIIDKRTDMDEFFNPYRSYLIGGVFQSLIGNPASFGLSDFYNMKLRNKMRA